MRLRLLNTSATPWSPIAGNNNTLIITDSTLADNQWAFGTSVEEIYDSTASLISARQSVTISLFGVIVQGDAIAKDSGILYILPDDSIDSIVYRNVIASGNGTVTIEGGRVKGNLKAREFGHITVLPDGDNHTVIEGNLEANGDSVVVLNGAHIAGDILIADNAIVKLVNSSYAGITGTFLHFETIDGVVFSVYGA